MSHSDIKTGKVKDKEGYMAHSQMGTMRNAIGRLKKNIKKKDQQIPAWVQSKITKASDYVDTAADYMDSNESFTIDPKAHRKAQKDQKIRNMTKSPNENEAVVDKKKAKGPEWQKPTLQKNSFSLVDQILSEIDLNEDLSIQDAKGNEMYQVVDLIKPEPIISEQGACGECGCRECVCEKGEVEKWEDSEEAHEDLEESDHKGEKKYCKKCKKEERRDECKYGGKVWDRMTSDDDDDDSEDSGDVSEAVRMKARTGNLVAVILTWRGKSLMVRMFFPSLNYPSRSEVEAEVIKIYPGARVINYRRIEVTPGAPVVHVGEEVEINEKMKEVSTTNARTLGSRFKNEAERQTYLQKLAQKSKDKAKNRLKAAVEEVEVEEKVDLTKQSSKRKSLGRGSSIKDGSKPRGYESPKEFRDAEKKFSGTEEKNVHGEVENPSGNLKKLVSRAVNRVDTDVDGDGEHNDKHKGEYGEFVPTPDGKRKFTGGKK